MHRPFQRLREPVEGRDPAEARGGFALFLPPPNGSASTTSASGQPTSAQFKAALDAQSKTLTDATAGNLMGECVKAVRAKVELLQTLAAPQPKPPANPQGR